MTHGNNKQKKGQDKMNVCLEIEEGSVSIDGVMLDDGENDHSSTFISVDKIVAFKVIDGEGGKDSDILIFTDRHTIRVHGQGEKERDDKDVSHGLGWYIANDLKTAIAEPLRIAGCSDSDPYEEKWYEREPIKITRI